MSNPRLDHEADDEGHEPSDTRDHAQGTTWKSGYRDTMRVREFRFLWFGHALSIIGTNLLNIAVSVLVYRATDSAFAAGITLAVTFLPPIIAGPLLSGLADVFPRKQALIVCDLARAVFILAVGVPGIPVWAIWTLLFLSVVPAVPFTAARAALLAEIVQGERYVAGTAIIHLTTQLGMLIGLIAGGFVVSLIGPNTAVMVNAAIFVLSALLVTVGVRTRPAPNTDADGNRSRPGLGAMITRGTRLVLTDPRLRTLALMAWVAGLYMVPYGIANPMADELGAGAGAAGIIMAGPSIGALIGGFLLTRFVPPPTRMRWLGPLTVLASVPLLLWILPLPLWLMVGLLALSGAAASYQIVANATFVLCTPEDGRGLAFGLVAAGLQASQGIGILLGSLLVELFGTSAVITGAGVVGVVLGAVLAATWSRMAEPAIEKMNEAEQPA